MVRAFWLIMLGALLYVCMVPFYSMAIIFPITFLFGPAKWLYEVQLILSHALSAATAAWLVSRLWRPNQKHPPIPGPP